MCRIIMKDTKAKKSRSEYHLHTSTAVLSACARETGVTLTPVNVDKNVIRNEEIHLSTNLFSLTISLLWSATASWRKLCFSCSLLSLNVTFTANVTSRNRCPPRCKGLALRNFQSLAPPSWLARHLWEMPVMSPGHPQPFSPFS